MDTELIKCLHKLSTKANRIILSKIEINHIVQIEDEFELEQFLDAYCCGLQIDLKNTNENTINIIIKNLLSAIGSNCGNSIDLTKYSKEDDFYYSCITYPNERSVYKRYKINSFSPKDISIFKEIWLFNFLENLKTILFNIKYILNISQQENIKKPSVVEKKQYLKDLFKDSINEYSRIIELLIKNNFLVENDDDTFDWKGSTEEPQLKPITSICILTVLLYRRNYIRTNLTNRVIAKALSNTFRGITVSPKIYGENKNNYETKEFYITPFFFIS